MNSLYRWLRTLKREREDPVGAPGTFVALSLLSVAAGALVLAVGISAFIEFFPFSLVGAALVALLAVAVWAAWQLTEPEHDRSHPDGEVTR